MVIVVDHRVGVGKVSPIPPSYPTEYLGLVTVWGVCRIRRRTTPLVGGHPGTGIGEEREDTRSGRFTPGVAVGIMVLRGSPKGPARGPRHELGYVSLCVCVCGILAIIVDNRVLPGGVCVGSGGIGINTADLVVEIRWFGEAFG